MNGIVVVDKPDGWTSHDVIGKLRGVLGERRMGHSGTLDPLATGVLPVFVGRATRAVEFCEADEKEYIAGLRTGIVTDTQDITGTMLETRDGTITRQQLANIIPEFTGRQLQLPPMYSAIKYKGKKLYELARRGVEVERQPREIEIRCLEIQDFRDGDYILRIVCTKGTYVRTLCHDIGQRLGCGAAMSSLRRVRAGGFSLDGAVTIEEIVSAASAGSAETLLRPVDSVFSEYPAITVDPDSEEKCRHGAEFALAGTGSGRYRVYSESGEFLLLGQFDGKIMKTVKSFFEV